MNQSTTDQYIENLDSCMLVLEKKMADSKNAVVSC